MFKLFLARVLTRGATLHLGRLHDLAVLLNLLLGSSPQPGLSILPAIRTLSAFAVEFRYPGITAR